MPGDGDQQQQQQQNHQQNQQQQGPWYGQLKADAPAEFKEWIANKNFPDPQAALFSAFSQEKLIGAEAAGRTVILPKDDKDAEGIKAYRAKIGVPEKPEGYGTPESLKDDPIWPIATQVAHEFGLPKSAFVPFVEKVMAKANELNAQNAQKADGERTAGLTALQGEWGDKYAANNEHALRAVKAATAGLSAEDAKLFTDAVTNDARFKRIFAKFGTMLAEHGFSGGDGGSEALSVRKQIDDLKARRLEGKLTQQEFLEQMRPLEQKMTQAA